jgi:hypothetical protein
MFPAHAIPVNAHSGGEQTSTASPAQPGNSPFVLGSLRDSTGRAGIGITQRVEPLRPHLKVVSLRQAIHTNQAPIQNPSPELIR